MLSSTKIMTGTLIAWFTIFIIWGISLGLWSNCTPPTGPGDVPCDPGIYALTAMWLQWSHFGFAAGFVLLFVFFLVLVVKLIRSAPLHAVVVVIGLFLLFASLVFYAIYAPFVMTAFDSIGWFGFFLGEFGIAMWFRAQPLVWVWILWGITFGYVLLVVVIPLTKLIKIEKLEGENTGVNE